MRNLLFAIALIGLASCHTAKKAVVTAPPKVETPKSTEQPATVAIQLADTTYRPPDSTQQVQDQKRDSVVQFTEDVYRFKVSFISTGSGIDNKAKRKYSGFIRDYESQNKVSLPYEEVNVGNQGQIDLGFMLVELSAVQQAKFISESKEFLKGFSQVQYSEHITPHAPPGKGPGLLGPP